MQLETIRSEIERMRAQVARQRKEILQLQRAGIPTASADALLQRMLDRIDALCAERDRLKKELAPVKVVDGRADPWRRATRVRR
jgi:gamma-glutamyl phosphate reductase